MRLLQLSDIHFMREVDGIYDMNRELRWQLMEALPQAAASSGLDAVLVCGDVAFSGQPDEYTRATKFLRDVASRLQIDQDMIFVIPGNHDIDRQTTDSPAQRELRSGLRVVDTDVKRDAALAAAAQDAAKAALLMAPLREYTVFAAQYDCPTSAGQPCWDRSLYLTDDVELAIRGINSVLASHAHDHEEKERLVVGTGQAVLEPGDGRLHITMCHHPREWILGATEMSRRLDKRVLVQITGHTHEFVVIETEGGVWLRAGALHPSRFEENWEPHFSIIELDVDGAQVAATIRPWAWDPDQVAFVAREPSRVERPAPSGSITAERREQVDHALAVRRLLVRLAALPAGDILNAAIEAGLPPLAGAIADAPGVLALEAVSRAVELGLLEALWTQVDVRRGATVENPFV